MVAPGVRARGLQRRAAVAALAVVVLRRLQEPGHRPVAGEQVADREVAVLEGRLDPAVEADPFALQAIAPEERGGSAALEVVAVRDQVDQPVAAEHVSQRVGVGRVAGSVVPDPPVGRDHVDLGVLGDEAVDGREVAVGHDVVGVGEGHPVARGVLEPDIAGARLAGVLLGDEGDQLGTALDPAPQDVDGPVDGPVVDHHDLDPVEGEGLLLDRGDEVLEITGDAVHRADDAEAGRGEAGHRSFLGQSGAGGVIVPRERWPSGCADPGPVR